MFKSVKLYRVAGDWPDSEEALSEALAAASFKPCSPFAMTSAGWESPRPDSAGAFSRRLSGADLLQLRTQTRVLPTSAINEAVEARIAEFRARTEQEPGRREKRRLKEQMRDELLPQALLRSDRTKAFMLIAERILGIDVGSPAKAEHFIEQLRGPLKGLSIVPLTFEQSVGHLLTRIFLGDAPPGIKLGRECLMQDPTDKRAYVRWADMELADASIRKHVRDGMKLTHLGIHVGSTMSCVLDEDGGISKLKFAGLEFDDEVGDDDPLARFDAEFVVSVGTLRQFIGMLGQALGGIEDLG
jgi:recombination associated protein RdgC